jgi:hypothetical protein
MTNATERKASNNRPPAPPTTGWTWIDNAVIDFIVKIGLAAFTVYVVLARYANANRQAWPSAKTIMQSTGLAKRSVWRAISALKKANLIAVEATTHPNGRPANNRYTLVPLGNSDTKAPRVDSDTIDSDTGDTIDSAKNDMGIVTPEHQEQDLIEQDLSKNKKSISSAKADSPADLLALIDGWNSLGDQIVKTGNGARRDPPAKAVLSGWKKAIKNPEQRDHFQDIPALLEKIRAAKYCHGQDWFSLPWLFGKNKNKELVIPKIMAGLYSGDNSNGNSKRSFPVGPGQKHGSGNSAIGKF